MCLRNRAQQLAPSPIAIALLHLQATSHKMAFVCAQLADSLDVNAIFHLQRDLYASAALAASTPLAANEHSTGSVKSEVCSYFEIRVFLKAQRQKCFAGF